MNEDKSKEDIAECQVIKRNNIMALVGFILAIISVFVYSIVGIIPILALVFSIIGLTSFNAKIHKNKWMVTWGLIISIIYTGMYFTTSINHKSERAQKTYNVNKFESIPRSTYDEKIGSNPSVFNSQKDVFNDSEFSSIENKYIKVMRYFNKMLDHETADEIYWAIASLHSEFPNVDARLVMALFGAGSEFNPKAESPDGAKGLGQLTPEMCKTFFVDNPFDVNENTRGIFMFLDKEFSKWKDKKYILDFVIASKYAGSDKVKKYNGIPPDKETQDFVRKVINIYTQLLLENEREEKLHGKTSLYLEK